MVKDLHVHQGERFLEVAGEEFIRLAGLGGAAWMVVREDHRRCIVRERGLDDLARINAGLGERAAKSLVKRSHPVLGVKPDANEDLMLATAQCKLQVIAYRP